ncbi:MAG: helix-turn-helix transcriptional regulator [Planctomycetes bacterium]|nr:helix-turn-helix transcriptional regulator [Planctomycetota bacterium]
MPNIAAALKEEIARLTRKELRGQSGGLKKASSQHRRDIAALKRQVTKLESQVSLLEKHALKKAPDASEGDTTTGVRFTAKGLQGQLKRLGLTATDFSKLVGVTPQSIYNWARGTSRPRKEQIAAIVALRGVGKREAKVRLRQLGDPKPNGKKQA